MQDFEEKLNAILSSPDAMAQVASIAKSLGFSTESEHTPPDTPTMVSEENVPDLSSLFSQIDPALLQRLLPLLSQLNAPKSSEREQLLSALKPFLKESRREKVDQAMQLARVLHIGRNLFDISGG